MATLRVPDIVPSPAEDCKTLKKAFQGLSLNLLYSFICECNCLMLMVIWLVGFHFSRWGTDEKAIIKVLGRRNASQRNNIRETFQQLYNKSLIDELVSKLSGDFRKAVILWTYDPPERDARLVNEALKSRKKGIREFQVIVEIACASSPHHLVAVRKAYFSFFDCSLEEDISSNVSLPIQKVSSLN
ncbi:unnamed protein product [Coffea canephora]|uniref:DH200=94 genomic scaffold, scaffold_291 n=1 Tax=Coffea canephora TaxID=49390 RepID=A0A068VGL4_COFCA|nr:unnamed protein product [Coffea canephora]